MPINSPSMCTAYRTRVHGADLKTLYEVTKCCQFIVAVVSLWVVIWGPTPESFRHSAWLSEEFHDISPDKRHILVLYFTVQVRVTMLAPLQKSCLFFPGDSVPVLGVRAFLMVYWDHILNVSILVTIHVEQRDAGFYWLNFKEIFLTLLIKLAYAYPAEYKHVDQYKKYIAYKLE